ncbi:transposase [Spiroplasma endosymbiont of Polydrusus pterygomalis]|uniref:transposase n=1 Tax=Spiroplasma endosymbiont of Polydrusus pterygomalis TaxID=3139327 RepID=UPI003CCA7B5A
MAKGKIKGSKDHSFEFKEKIVNEYSINNKSYSEIAKEYHISLATISKWVNQFQQNKEILKERKKRKYFELNKFKKPLERENYLLKKENERIKAENEVLKKLVALPKIKTKTNIRKQIAFIKS